MVLPVARGAAIITRGRSAQTSRFIARIPGLSTGDADFALHPRLIDYPVTANRFRRTAQTGDFIAKPPRIGTGDAHFAFFRGLIEFPVTTIGRRTAQTSGFIARIPRLGAGDPHLALFSNRSVEITVTAITRCPGSIGKEQESNGTTEGR
jgi:hypothetical protein